MKTSLSLNRFLCGLVLGLGAMVSTQTLRSQDLDRDGVLDAKERGFGRYQVILGSFTWQQARADAELRGGHLATVVSDLEWADMRFVLGGSILGRNLWLGGTDEGSEGSWRWITGERWRYTHWRDKEPGNDSSGNGTGQPENYLMIWGNETAALDGNGSFWNDASAAGGLLARDGYILERGFWTDFTDPDTDDDGLSDGEEGGEGSRYQVIKTSMQWAAAKSDAEARGGYLAVISSDREWQIILAAIGNSLLSENLWIGGSDEVLEGTWRWLTGDPFLYSRFAPNQPDNLGEQDFLMMRAPQGLWFDMASHVSSGYLFERSAPWATDPKNPDTDGDGLKDGDEAKFYLTDSLKVDTDQDTLSDFDEIRRRGSSPLIADTDGDRLTDAQEVFTHGTDPTKRDSDGDGFTDGFEVGYGSNPKDAANLPGPRSTIYTGIELEFDTRLNEKYQIQMLQPAGGWANFGTVITGTGSPINRLISARGQSKGLFRVILTK